MEMEERKQVYLDLTAYQSCQELHAYLKRQFGFEDFYGENLDALYDGLTSVMEDVDVILEEEEDTCCEAVYLEESAQSEEMRKYCRKVRRVIEDAAEENGHIHL